MREDVNEEKARLAQYPYLGRIAYWGMFAADHWYFSHSEPMTPSETSRGQVFAAIQQLVAVGMLVPCSEEELAAIEENGIPLLATFEGD